ncbi:MAG: ATP-dependent sacrificial sulfur transferase LarE [Pseudomonadota bacterium]
MEKIISDKLEQLIINLKKHKTVLVAFSGGVDSTLLLKVALDTLGRENVIAVTIDSDLHGQRESSLAKDIAKNLNAVHEKVKINILESEEILNNNTDRCYVCKKQIFLRLVEMAKQWDLNKVVEGSNFDDLSDFRPGMKALSELGIESPLKNAKLLKDEIRKISASFGLETANKPSSPCLATRIPFGKKITKEKLVQIEKAEDFLHEMGISPIRVRHHNQIARIEVHPKDFDLILNKENSQKILSHFNQIGYNFITLDIQGYKQGNMNKGIK